MINITMAILKTNTVFYFFSTFYFFTAVISGEMIEEVKNDRLTEFITKDEIKKVLDFVKHQEQTISELKIEMRRKDEALVRFDKRVTNLEMLVLEQSKTISEVKASQKFENESVKDVNKDTKKTNARKVDLKMDDTNEFYNKTNDHSAYPERSINKRKMKKRNASHTVVPDRYERRAITAQISFSAYLSHIQEHLGAHQTVKFDKVITNEGNGYNAVTGIFTVPVTGTYVFTFYVCSSTANVQFDLMADGYLKTSGVARPAEFDRSKDVQGGGTVILLLNKGATVWIESHYTDGTVFSESVHRWVTFSGFLLH